LEFFFEANPAIHFHLFAPKKQKGFSFLSELLKIAIAIQYFVMYIFIFGITFQQILIQHIFLQA